MAVTGRTVRFPYGRATKHHEPCRPFHQGGHRGHAFAADQVALPVPGHPRSFASARPCGAPRAELADPLGGPVIAWQVIPFPKQLPYHAARPVQPRGLDRPIRGFVPAGRGYRRVRGEAETVLRGQVGQPRGGVEMAVIIFTGTQRRLAVRGPCLEADRSHVVDALEAFGRSTPALILDLRRVSVLSWSVAEAILLACDRMRLVGAEVHLLTTPAGAVERMVDAARGSTARGADHVASGILGR